MNHFCSGNWGSCNNFAICAAIWRIFFKRGILKKEEEEEEENVIFHDDYNELWSQWTRLQSICGSGNNKLVSLKISSSIKIIR